MYSDLSKGKPQQYNPRQAITTIGMCCISYPNIIETAKTGEQGRLIVALRRINPD
jgi:hypothetical protein